MEPAPTLSSLSGLWLKECEGLIFPETIRIYATMMQDHVLPGLGDRLSFTQEEVKAFLDGKLAAGMAESSVAMMERVLRRVLEYGHSLGLCEEPSWSISMGTPKSKKGVVILTQTEENQLANYLVTRPLRVNNVTTVQAIRSRVTHGFAKLCKRLEEINAVEGWDMLGMFNELCDRIEASAPPAPKRTGPKGKPTVERQYKKALAALESIRESQSSEEEKS